MVNEFVNAGGKVLRSDKNTRYLLKNYRQLHGIPEGGVDQTEKADEVVEVPAYLEPQPPPTAGRAAPPCDAGDLHEENALDAAGGEASGSNTRLSSLQQSTIRRWVDNDAQKKLDIAWAEAMFRAGIPFNFLDFETTQKLHETVEPLTTCWDVSGCTFITDGSSDRRERPVMNFLAAGVDGAVLVATVSMSGRKKTGPALAKLWEKIMREIGLRRINAICTDNAEVNKRAAQILERRTDKEVARIPWVPCAAHCCSLLLRDLSKLDWVKHTVKRGHTLVKFIRNHHSTNSQMMTVNDSLSLLRPTEVRFGLVYQMLERIYDRRAVLKDIVHGRNAAKWNAIRWSTSKLRARSDLVYFTLRSDEWWTGLNKVVEVMEPVFGLLRRMDQDGTAPTNLVEYDNMIERKLSHIILTVEQRASVMEKVKDCMKMMRQPVHATTFLLDPHRRDPRWLHDQDSAFVENAMRFLSRQVRGEWKGQEHLDIWSDLNEFHTKPTRNDPKRNATKMWDPTAKADVDKQTLSEWWAAHGGDVPKLQKIAIKVMGMWSTASPTESNWASMDFIHSKRRNKLLPESLAKLVYIHWNMQLLRVPETKNNGFVDLWCDFVEPAPEPEENDGSVSKGPEDEAEKTEEEFVRERRLTKTPKGRVPRNLEDKDEELTDDSDLDDELWKGKCGFSEDSSGSKEDDDDDSDFELRSEPSVPGTMYVGRRQTGRQRREEPRSAAMEPGVMETALYNPQSDVEFTRLDTDVETLLETRVDEDEEDANRAKAMADRETELVNKRMMEEEARRATIPTRREIERGLKQAREHQQQINQALEVVEEGEEEERWSTKKKRKARCNAGRKRKCSRKRRGKDWCSRRCSTARSIQPAKTSPVPQRQQSTHAGPGQRSFRSPRRRYRNSPQGGRMSSMTTCG
ncbi:hypothetical protein CBR_g38621 [Chara braunii]|uniref:DUF659 domain-containing protein n=1 Tax=Chara braunii TaxID=69332 RepID=A0A388K0H5_CHABU|nr:hypothetical protein CBR_g38621 [Chara braunii]|eukprot:GBG63554.1 hypothetical protein CBR_g38621 [Chara braunii]